MASGKIHPLFSSRKRILESGIVILILVVAAAVITMPFVQITATSLHDDTDALQQAWIIGWVAHQVLQDPLHLYEALNYYPYPHTLSYMDSMVPQSLLALPIILATANLPLAYNLSIWFALVMNGYAMYMLLRAWRGSFGGALIGGFIFAFGFYHLIHLGHLNLLSTQWIPLTLLFLDHAIEDRTHKDFALFGLFFLLSALSSFYYAFFTAALVAIYFAYQLILARGRFPLRVWLGLGISAIGVFILVLPFGLPYIQVSRDLGLVRSADEVKIYSATLTSYLASRTSNPAFAWVHQLFPAPNLESVLSPGLLALLLVLYGLYRGSAGARTGVLVAIAAVGMVLSLGVQTQLGQWTIPLPYRLVYDYVLGFGSMRGVARWGVLVLFAAAALAGLGFSDLVSRWGQRRTVASVAISGVMLVGLCLEYNQTPTPALPGRPFSQPLAPVYEWLKTQPDAAVAELPIGEPGEFYVPDTWYQYYALFYRKPLVNGRSGFDPPSYGDIYRRLAHFPSAEALDFLRSFHVRYVIVHSSAIPDWDVAKRRLSLFKTDLHLIAVFGDDYVYEPSPDPSPPVAEFTLALPTTVLPSSQVRASVLAKDSQTHGAVFSQRGTIEMHLRWLDAIGQVREDETQRHAAPLLVEEAAAVVPFQVRTPSQAGTYRVLADVTGMPQASHFEEKVDVRPPLGPATGPAIQLADYWIGRRATRSGEDLNVTLFWQVRGSVAGDYIVFIDVLDVAGKNRADLNGPPDPDRPTHQWQVGEVMVEHYLVPLPRGLPQGQYSLAVRMFQPSTGENLPILGAEGETDTNIILDRAAWIGAGWRQTPPQPSHSRSVAFGDGSDLVGYELKTTSFAPGETIPLVLYWQSRERTREDYTVFIHLLDANGKIVTQADAPPLGGSYPTFAWNVGEWVRDPHPIRIPDDVAPGDYSLRIGWYRLDTRERAIAQLDDGGMADHVDIGTIRVVR